MSELKSDFRVDFPALSRKIRNKKWHYLDSAATSLKPWPVIERLSKYYSYETANVHRGAFFLADQATSDFEATRAKAANFLHAKQPEEIIFTKGTTEGLNLLAYTLGLSLKAGDEILLSESEHHSNIVPWQLIAKHNGAKILPIRINDDGDIDFTHLQSLLSEKTKIVSITQCSNVLGTITDIKKVSALVRKLSSAKVVVDGAQAAANLKIDVQDLDVDFYVLSMHKIFGPYGVGLLYGKLPLLQELPPFNGGGSMIADVKFEQTTFLDSPHRFEAGTPAIGEVIASSSALDYLTEKATLEKAHAYEARLYQELLTVLQSIDGVKVYGRTTGPHAPLISLTMAGVHSSDLAQILDQENVCVRSGHMCAQPLMRRFGTSGFLRCSLSLYNDSSDLLALQSALKKAKEMLR